MLRTTKPSVLVPSQAAIAADITAISSRSSVSGTVSSITAGSSRTAGVAKASFGFLNAASIFGMNQKREIMIEIKISTANTVPIPRSVLRPDFLRISDILFSALTVKVSR